MYTLSVLWIFMVVLEGIFVAPVSSPNEVGGVDPVENRERNALLAVMLIVLTILFCLGRLFDTFYIKDGPFLASACVAINLMFQFMTKREVGF